MIFSVLKLLSDLYHFSTCKVNKLGQSCRIIVSFVGQNFPSKDFVPQLQSGNGQELYQPEALGELDGEPLIRVELDIVQSPDASVNLLNIQFSNLDIIGKYQQLTIFYW